MNQLAIDHNATAETGGNARRVTEHWGSNAPEWVWALAQACDLTNQTAVAKQLGISSSLISGVLGQKYRGDMETFEHKVRGLLMRETVSCPIAGDITRNVCIQHQERARSGRLATSSIRTRFNKMCPNCPNNMTGGNNVSK